MPDVKQKTSLSLSEALSEVRTFDRRCVVLRTLETMSENDASALLLAIDNHSVSLKHVSQILQAHGVRVSDHSLRNHRNRSNGGCRCPR